MRLQREISCDVQTSPDPPTFPTTMSYPSQHLVRERDEANHSNDDHTGAPEHPTIFEAYQFHASANFLFGILSDAGERFDRDYTAFVVYCAFVVASAADTLRDVTSRKRRDGYAAGVLSAHSLAAMTGVPRETIRRKCMQLVERGLIERLSAGQFRCKISGAEADALIRQFQQIQPFR